MKIHRIEKYLNEKARTELFGNERSPSNVISRQDQHFYDFYTRKKFKGMSKYELNSEVYKIAKKDKENMGILAQFCMQIERESIAADDYIVSILDEITKSDIALSDADNGNQNNYELDNGKVSDDMSKLRKKMKSFDDKISNNKRLQDRIDDLEKSIIKMEQYKKENKKLNTKFNQMDKKMKELEKKIKNNG